MPAPLPLIPYPRALSRVPGTCTLGLDSVILIEPGADHLAAWAAPLLDLLRHGTGLPLPLATAASGAPAHAPMVLGLLDGRSAEAYTLDVGEHAIVLRANDREGTVWGLQTLRQLLPSDLERPLPTVIDDPGRPDGKLRPRPDRWLPPPGKPPPWPTVDPSEAPNNTPSSNSTWTVPCVQIEDHPRFAWRGLLLDSCRHFQDVAAIERLIDLMSLHKLNRLHWHLTEDQGWRLEIRSRPRLTEVAAWRTESDGVRYGGFYTQDQARHVVAYAAARGITVVPEIELPGHCQAALAAYPELSCRGLPLTVQTEWGVFEDIYCAGNEAVFTFLQDVLTEVLAIFPSEFIHLGGDECPADRWLECERCRARLAAEKLDDTDALHGWFVQRLTRWLAERGRRAIGWDEILAGGLAPGVVVQSWRGFEGATAALAAGHDAIVSPISHVYLDQECARVSLQTVLAFDPAVDTGGDGGSVLGGEMCLWTEWVPQAVIDERVWPRGCAGSEVLWAGQRFADFMDRLAKHQHRLRAMKVRIA